MHSKHIICCHCKRPLWVTTGQNPALRTNFGQTRFLCGFEACMAVAHYCQAASNNGTWNVCIMVRMARGLNAS
jgi:hypothetical protein